MAALGKMLILLGIVIILMAWPALCPEIPYLGRLPGDIYVKKDNFTFYFPWPRAYRLPWCSASDSGYSLSQPGCRPGLFAPGAGRRGVSGSSLTHAGTLRPGRHPGLPPHPSKSLLAGGGEGNVLAGEDVLKQVSTGPERKPDKLFFCSRLPPRLPLYLIIITIYIQVQQAGGRDIASFSTLLLKTEGHRSQP